MKARYYHGTTEAGMLSIMQGTGKDSLPCAWVCSNRDGYSYLYSVEALAAEEREDDEEYAHTLTIERAFEAATIQAARIGVSQNLYVLGFDLPDDQVEKDNSCENMTSAVQVPEEALTADSLRVVYVTRFNGYTSPAALVGVWDNDLFIPEGVPEDLQVMVQVLASSKELDYLSEMAWSHCTSSQLLWCAGGPQPFNPAATTFKENL